MRKGDRLSRPGFANDHNIGSSGKRLRHPRVFVAELREENAVELREPLLAMEVLVCEARYAEREIPLGEGWRRRRGFQEGGILPRERRGERTQGAAARLSKRLHSTQIE